MKARVLVAGIGNVFFGDDGFGVEVVRRLAARPLPDGVEVVDFGIRGLDLSFALTFGYDLAILVDATRRGRPPGTLSVLDLDDERPHPALDTHGMDPVKVLGLAREIGPTPKRLRLVGCEPEPLGDDDAMTMGLSAPVLAAVEGAIALIESLVGGGAHA
jgi:hydrogenase maturation protease